ncbi:peptidylprolyl isomerase family protein [Pararhodobacter zhoushanensis]|uniref:Parvulin-like PPIase n=1 Tax=Pararhodobacter zhoushanensis TaxID=2479545 RepID=A0ABT3H137_9RHOB|nr:hypothetical protein [Pararhodobacter zhoushanensis]MCW1933554.1 hypothetical protein [Pararhodobacter zhoushanensis]
MHAMLFRPTLFKTAPRVLLGLFMAAAVALAAPAAQAQSPFAAALYVNDDAVTNYEITQKMRFLEFIGVTNADMRQLAIERLIEDRLQLQEASRLGGRVTPDIMAAGMSEFAARAELTTEEMVTRMGQAGIDRETFETFIRSGVLWRELIQQLYGAQVSITNAQIDQALSVEGIQPSTEVLISEIFLPSDPQFAEAVQRIIPQIERITTEAEFANAARQVSAAPSGPSGGRVERWINVQAVPEPVGPAMATAAVGTVFGPLDMPGAYAFFQLRARRDLRAVPSEAIELDYRRADIPGGLSDTNRAAVARIRDNVDSCVDFDAVVLRTFPELPLTAVQTLTERQSALSSGVRGELERLNAGELSASMVENGQLAVMMLCARRVATDAAPARSAVRAGLLNQALEGQAAIYLQRLRAEADIRYP